MNKVIVAVNAKNIHKALAPWCLKSYCDAKGVKDLGVIEVNINDSVNEVTAKFFAAAPAMAAFSCYIWNIEYVKKLGGLLKKLLPGLKIILGGPEVSFEKDLEDFPFADYLIRGPGEKAFYDLLSAIEQGIKTESIIDGCSNGFISFPTPFTDDYFKSFKNNQIPLIEKQLIYIESSRGCPFSCLYCLSSTTNGIHFLPLDRVISDIRRLLERGAKCLKFVDRVFNADKKRAAELLKFISALDTDAEFHFEAAADLFDAALFKIIKSIPKGRVQFEIGVQSVNPATLKAINRKTDTDAVLKNISILSAFKNCHIHADLIAGLPFETIETFKEAVNKCIAAKPNVLQLGFLKMLKGTRIRQESEFGVVFADFPPYEVYKTAALSYADIIELKKIEAVIERFYNSGYFASSVAYGIKLFDTPYDFFSGFKNYCIKDSFDYKVSMKGAYSVLYDFLCLHGDTAKAKHCIKMDSLSFDERGLLPDGIESVRSKQAELLYKEKTKCTHKVRAEFFELEGRYKLFIYDKRCPVANTYESIDICE